MTQKDQKNQIKNLLACAERLLCCMTEVQQDMDEAAKSIKQQKLLSDEIASKLENKLKEMTSITALLEKGMTPEDIINEILGDFGVEILDTLPAKFYCNCCKERVEQALISVGAKELNTMIKEAKPVELNCHFCNSKYTFSIEELKEILIKAKR